VQYCIDSCKKKNVNWLSGTHRMDGFCFGAGIWSVKLASSSQQSNEHAAHEEYLLYFLRRIHQT
jgi:hypothetical protein